jgi:hypothetical protein
MRAKKNSLSAVEQNFSEMKSHLQGDFLRDSHWIRLVA